MGYLPNPANLAAWQTSKTSVEQLTAAPRNKAHAYASARKARARNPNPGRMFPPFRFGSDAETVSPECRSDSRGEEGAMNPESP